jgi:hypothetical protein
VYALPGTAASFPDQIAEFAELVATQTR